MPGHDISAAGAPLDVDNPRPRRRRVRNAYQGLLGCQGGLVSRLIAVAAVAPGFLLMCPLTKHALGPGYEGLQVKGRQGLGFGAWGQRATVTSNTQESPLMSPRIYALIRKPATLNTPIP